VALARWDQRFFSSTRGQIVALLRRASRTVDELAGALGLTDNAVRSHLTTLERDGLVRQDGARRTSGKPASAYALTPEADALFPKAYGPVLRHLLDALQGQMSPAELDALLRAVGRQLAQRQVEAGESLRARLETAAALFGELGGLVDVEEHDGSFLLRGYSCPLATAVPDHPELCKLAESLVSELVGVAAHERCDRGKPPRCCFEITPQQTTAADSSSTAAGPVQEELDEPLGGEPPCWAHLLDDEGRLS
jgi:predicted ArsR family transcriptional regulator